MAQTIVVLRHLFSTQRSPQHLVYIYYISICGCWFPSNPNE